MDLRSRPNSTGILEAQEASVLAPPPTCSPPTGSTEFPERPGAGWGLKANLDAFTPFTVGGGQAMKCLLLQSRRETPAHLGGHSPTQRLTHRGTNKLASRLIATHTDCTWRAQAMVVTHSQQHGVSAPTASDPTWKAQSDTGIGSH